MEISEIIDSKKGSYDTRMKKIKIVLVVSLVLNLILISSVSFVLYKKGGVNFLWEQLKKITVSKEYPDYYLQKVDIFESLESSNIDKIFIGDSITDHGEFQEYFPEETVLNRGISNDDSKGVLNRIQEVINRNPKEAYLMIGVNDILRGTDSSLFEKNIRDIVTSFDKTKTKVIIQSVLPVNNEIYGGAVSNRTVVKFNEYLQSIAKESGAVYVDIFNQMVDSNNQLGVKYTIDGIHLNGNGYRVWINTISQ